MPDAVNMLFLCTGNFCRPIIAEGWVRHIGGNAAVVQFAGIETHGRNPRAIAVMREFRATRGAVERRVRASLGMAEKGLAR